MLGKIGGFLRMTLDDDEDSLEQTLEEEVQNVELYLDIERDRFGERLYTEFSVSTEARGATVPTFLLQPLFENALKHAVGASLDRVTLRLEAFVRDGRLHLQLTDNGPGFPAEEMNPDESRGIGLKNVRDRLRSVFGEDFAMHLGNGPAGGAKVELDLPLEKQGAARGGAGRRAALKALRGS